jgi:hypothetical protein
MIHARTDFVYCRPGDRTGSPQLSARDGDGRYLDNRTIELAVELTITIERRVSARRHRDRSAADDDRHDDRDAQHD